MEYKDLNRVFDQVKLPREREDAILADLLGSKEEVADMRENKRRRIPAAALAAVLVLVLAGTALAAEYFGKVEIKFVDDLFGSKDGYFAYGPDDRIPADSLPEGVLALCADLRRLEFARLPFSSWSKAEEYLGIELADNAVLDQFVKYNGIRYEGTSPSGHPEKRKAHCLMTVSANEQHLPGRVVLETTAVKGNCTVIQLVQLLTDAADEGDKTGIGTAFDGETAFREYVTPNGLEVVIYSEVIPDGIRSHVGYMAHFVKNGAFFTVELLANENWRIDGSKFYDPWETLTEILDAYE